MSVFTHLNLQKLKVTFHTFFVECKMTSKKVSLFEKNKQTKPQFRWRKQPFTKLTFTLEIPGLISQFKLESDLFCPGSYWRYKYSACQFLCGYDIQSTAPPTY